MDAYVRMGDDGASLDYLRASSLAQVRLQLAVLSGNRRGALREIDRLVEIDRHLSGERPGGCPLGEDLEIHLGDQRQAIASEKLALTAAVEFPRIARSERADEELVLGQDAEIDVVEDTEFGPRLLRVLGWLLVAAALCAALAIGLPFLAVL